MHPGIKGAWTRSKSMKVKIVPTILVNNFTEFKERLKRVEPFFALVQIDCADGKFVNNKTFYHVRKIKSLTAKRYPAMREKYKGKFELHLMIHDPLKEIKKWVSYRRLKRVIFHYEAVRDELKILEIISYLHKRGIGAGLAINPETKIDKILKFLPKLDVLLIMGVKPGWGGQAISLKVVKSKVYKVRKLYPKLDIEVDGGVSLKNIKQIIKAGANILAMGKALNSELEINQLRSLIK